MTIDDLYQYRDLIQEINAIEFQLKDLSMPVRSPAFDGMPHSTTPSDPTARAAEKIINLEADLERKMDAMIDKAREIEKWVDHIDDREIRALIRYHFFGGKTWRETSIAMYGSTARQTAQSRWKRWARDNF